MTLPDLADHIASAVSQGATWWEIATLVAPLALDADERLAVLVGLLLADEGAAGDALICAYVQLGYPECQGTAGVALAA